MRYRRLLTTCSFTLAAMFAPGVLTAASADIVDMHDFAVTLNGTTVFNDMFTLTQTLAGGAAPGKRLLSGVDFSDGVTPGIYGIIGTLKETGTKAVLNTAKGALATGPTKPPEVIRLNNIDLQTGPPTPTNPFSLTQSETFTTEGLFDLSVPSTPGGFYQLEFSDRVASNHGMGDVISVQVKNCAPGLAGCMGVTRPGYFIQLQDANFATGTSETIDRVPLDTSNQQILLELSHTAGSDSIFGSYAYVNGGVEGPLTTFMTPYNDLFANLNYTQAGFTQVSHVPEPSSLTLLAPSLPGVLGLVWFRRQKRTTRESDIEKGTL